MIRNYKEISGCSYVIYTRNTPGKYKSLNKHQIQENTLYMKEKTHLNIVKCEQRKKKVMYIQVRKFTEHKYIKIQYFYTKNF